MQMNMWDFGVLILGGLYINSRFNGGKNDSFNRSIIGVGTGVVAAKYGPEAISATKKYLTNIDRDKIIKGAVGVTTGALAYNITDVVKDHLNSLRQNNQKP